MPRTQNYGQAPVARLASAVGMSRSAFASLFTRTVGRPPLDYVRSWRLARARAMLASGEDNVAQVAITVGYASQSAFSHAYRRAFATTPRGDCAASIQASDGSAYDCR
ncbi:helix-turn-helix transcriptional regulator [Burkholderia gladioli]|uniref:helix-turn-helix transcriptional regulator n=1 Tax=Burkholderia gladioli TaxID=28095 RepID=UPI0020B6CD97|nr:helix-turn-helix transcriptional regulator [Burkholderia gladioli]